MGFTFDDTDPDATPVQEMHRLLAKDPRNAERIFPYLGGDELNTSPTHSHHRYVINFGEMTLEQASRWPDLLHILETKVRPERKKKSKEVAAWPWWQFWRVRNEMQLALRGHRRILVMPFVGKWHAPAFVPASTLIAGPANVLTLESFAAYAAVQCRPHEVWARVFSSSLEERPRYTPSDSFETFPFPLRYEANQLFEAVGDAYYQLRAAIMVKNEEGLTKTYNRFHDPEERSSDILKLRELHMQMDRTVLDAYGWADIKPVHDFREQLDESIRLTWGEDTRDEVMARLLELNRVRAEEESKAAPKTDAKVPRKTAKRKAKSDESTRKLFPEDDG
jgi:hypothetical protein